MVHFAVEEVKDDKEDNSEETGKIDVEDEDYACDVVEEEDQESQGHNCKHSEVVAFVMRGIYDRSVLLPPRVISISWHKHEKDASKIRMIVVPQAS